MTILFRKIAAMALVAGGVAFSSAGESFNGYTIADEGSYCWFADPRSLRYASPDGSIDMTYVGYIDNHGYVKAMQMDWLTGVRDEVMIRSAFQPDDHNNPSFLILPDGRVMVMYCRHTDEAKFYYRISQTPGDITTLGPERSIATGEGTTYPSPFIMSDDPGHIYLCWRGINWHPTIARMTLSADDVLAFDWGPKQIVQSSGARPYAKYFSNGKDKLYVAYTTGHPDAEWPNWLYFNVINVAGGQTPTLTDMNGVQLSDFTSTFNVNKTESYRNSYPSTIVDAPSNYRDWVWQTLVDTDGKPVIAMVRINQGFTQHEYYYAKRTGTEWRMTDLCNGGQWFHQTSSTEKSYSGGLAIDPSDTRSVYLAKPTAGIYGNIFEIWNYRLDEDGNIVSRTQITHDSEKNNVRPFIIPGSEGSPMRLTWLNGDYYYWINQSYYKGGFPTSVMADYEWQQPASTLNRVAVGNWGKSVTSQEVNRVSAPEELSEFSFQINLTLHSGDYGGTIFNFGDEVSYSVSKSNFHPTTTIRGVAYKSDSQLLTSDAYANHIYENAYHATSKLDEFTLFVTYDGAQLRVYRNGLLDQNIPATGLKLKDLNIGGFSGNLNFATIYDSALSYEDIRVNSAGLLFNTLDIPSEVTSDILFPTKLNGMDITVASSDPEIIATDGTVYPPMTDTEVDVTFTVIVGGKPVSATFPIVARARNVRKNNVVALYSFDEWKDRAASTVADLSGRGNDLKVVVGTNSDEANHPVIDGTLNLTRNTADGTQYADRNSYAIAPQGLLEGLRSYTVLVEVMLTSAGKAPRVFDFGAEPNNSFFLRAATVCAGIKYASKTTLTDAGSSLTLNQMYKMAVTFDARTHVTTLYLDGVPVKSGTENVNEPYMIPAYQKPDTRNYIGRPQWWSNGSSWKDNSDLIGRIDNFYLLNTALTPSEIVRLQSSDPTSAEVVAEEASESVYYDLYGRRVSPMRGNIYVRVTGGEVEKIRY